MPKRGLISRVKQLAKKVVRPATHKLSARLAVTLHDPRWIQLRKRTAKSAPARRAKAVLATVRGLAGAKTRKRRATPTAVTVTELPARPRPARPLAVVPPPPVRRVRPAVSKRASSSPRVRKDSEGFHVKRGQKH